MKKTAKKLSLKEVLDQERKKSDLVIFDAIRDNNGKGIEVGEVIKILKKIEDEDKAKKIHLSNK